MLRCQVGGVWAVHRLCEGEQTRLDGHARFLGLIWI